MEYIYKEVYFDKYCSTCKYSEESEINENCDECLQHSVNIHSHKPVNWKEKERGSK